MLLLKYTFDRLRGEQLQYEMADKQKDLLSTRAVAAIFWR